MAMNNLGAAKEESCVYVNGVPTQSTEQWSNVGVNTCPEIANILRSFRYNDLIIFIAL